MSNILTSSKSRATTNSNIIHNRGNLTDNDNNVQNSYLISGIISEIRPGGDALIETSHGITRAHINDENVQEQDQVKVRITYNDKGEKESEIFSNESLNARSQKLENKSFLNYVGNLFNPSKSSKLPSYPASFSYLAPNINQLKYGHIQIAKSLNVQILDSQNHSKENITIFGTVISNENGILLINSDIGILNIFTQTSVKAGKKIVIALVDKQDPSLKDDLKNTITSFMNYIKDNINLLRQIVFYHKQIHDPKSYKKLVNLATTSHDNVTLAKIFHQTSEIPASEVSNWINKEIVEPFEETSKNHKIKVLTSQFHKISELLNKMGIIHEEEKKEFYINIPNREEKAKITVMSKDNIIDFNLEIEHDNFDKILIEGKLLMAQKNIKHFTVTIHKSKNLPEDLEKAIRSEFMEHITDIGIEGEINFSKI